MKILSYLETYQLIDKLAKKVNLKLTDDLPSKIVICSGLLDDWVEALVILASEKGDFRRSGL